MALSRFLEGGVGSLCVLSCGVGDGFGVFCFGLCVVWIICRSDVMMKGSLACVLTFLFATRICFGVLICGFGMH